MQQLAFSDSNNKKKVEKLLIVCVRQQLRMIHWHLLYDIQTFFQIREKSHRPDQIEEVF